MNQVVQITGPATTAAEGWMKPAFPHSGKAHYFEQELELPSTESQGSAYAWHSLCGIDSVSTGKVPMFEAGSWSRCKRCEHRLEKIEQTKGEAA
ncbi:hypothetical protein [Pseudomonas huaxiensis]|uniref:hypothetical protein n=1 Tax=Pseudomonas huaxiensis TaxID=2213017 RepID=UPI000DA6D4BC|nr:hypothetical protein [Pseudomonas huaxiensis]